MSKIIVYQSHIDIIDYTLGENPLLEKGLSVFDKAYYKYIPIGYIYDKENKILKLASGMDLNYLSSVLKRNVENNYIVDPYDKISLRLKSIPKTKLQQEAIQFLIGEGKYSYSKIYSQLILNLDTGEGKTYCAIAASVYLGYKVMVITHQSNIKNQWIDGYSTFTDIDPKCIVNIDSSSKLMNILENEKLINQTKVFTINHRTLRNIFVNMGDEYFSNAFKQLKIGLKIYDEAHLEFENILLVDSYSNTKKTIYLTATFGRSDIAEDKIFQMCFKGIPKYNQMEQGHNNSRHHIVYLAYFYNTNPSEYSKARCRNKYGFDSIAYSKYIIDAIDKTLPHIIALIKKFSINEDGYKTLITISTIESCETLRYLLQETFSELNVGIYHSKVSIKEKENTIKNSNIIVSTSKSLGVGVNIPNLRVIINCEAFGSKIIGTQISGRLRELSDDKKSLYIEMMDLGFSSIKNQYNRRIKLYKQTFGKLMSMMN